MSWPLEAIDVMLLKLLLTTFAVLLGYRLYRSHLNHRLHKNEDVGCAGYEIVPGTLTQSAGGRGLILSAHLRPRTSRKQLVLFFFVDLTILFQANLLLAQSLVKITRSFCLNFTKKMKIVCVGSFRIQQNAAGRFLNVSFDALV